MLFYLNLEKYQFDELFQEVSEKKVFLRIKLKLLEYMQLWSGNLKIRAPYCCIDFGRLKRAFLVNQDGTKIISFSFPFLIKTSSPDYKASNSICSIHYCGQYGIILPRNISEALAILTKYSSRDDNLYNELIFDDEDEIVPESFRLFEYILFSEDGYIRYDYDYQHQNAITHPLNHFDIHYSEPSHYKIGLPSKLDLNTFLTIIDKEKVCSKLDPNPIPEYLNILHKRKGKKNKILRRKKKKNKLIIILLIYEYNTFPNSMCQSQRDGIHKTE